VGATQSNTPFEPSDPTSLPVLFLAGEGRSGTTVLSTILAGSPDCCCVGELHGIWNAVRTDELCSCGQSFHACKFWSRVGDLGFGGWDRLDLDRTVELSAILTRQRHIPRLAVPVIRRRYSRPISDYGEILSQLYRAIQRTSGRRIVVDSSKGLPYALLLRHVPRIDVHLLHLVRDSRGVAYSWSKRGVVQPQYQRHPTLASRTMFTQAPTHSAARWLVANCALQVLGQTAVPYARMTYEAFTLAPDAVLLQALRRAELLDAKAPEGWLTHPRSGAVTFEPPTCTHMIGGNPMRFHHGAIELRADHAWRVQMPASSRRIVTVLTLPLLIAYGYVP
jgi:hypothetical protein